MLKPLHQRPLPKDYAGARKLAKKISQSLGKVPDDDFIRATHQYLTAIIIHVNHVGRDKTLRGVRDFVFDYGSSGMKKIHLMMNTDHDWQGRKGWNNYEGQPTKTNPHVSRVGHMMCEMPEGQRGSIVALARTALLEMLGEIQTPRIGIGKGGSGTIPAKTSGKDPKNDLDYLKGVI